MSSEAVIRVEGLGKTYQIYEKPVDRLLQMFFQGRKSFHKEFHALEDVSFDVKRGETVGIIGRNGSGKSTLLQLICGTLNPTSGSSEVKGRVAALLELGSGFNAQFTGRENVYLNGALLGLTKEEINDRFDDIESFAEIGQFIDEPVKTYSSGMVVRLAFAVIAHVDADILVIDEALAVGDAIFTQKCMRFLKAFKKERTLLFVSHDSSAVANLCDKAIWLKSGRVQNMGNVTDVIQSYHADNLKAIAKSLGPKDEEEITKGSFEKKADENEIEVLNQGSGFNHKSQLGGIGTAQILAAGFRNNEGVLSKRLKGGEKVSLIVISKTFQPVEGLLVGYTLKNRLGEVLIEDNNTENTKEKQIMVPSEAIIRSEFKFKMPKLREAEYVLDLAIAEGTREKHVQLIWQYDALVVSVHEDSPVFGLVAPEDNEISVQVF